MYTVDREILPLKNFHRLLRWRKLNAGNILCNVCRPIPKFSCLSLSAKIRVHEKFPSEIFTGENIPICGIRFACGLNWDDSIDVVIRK